MDSNGFFNYMSKNSRNSLFRNGKVLTKRDINGSDAGSSGIDLEKEEMQVINARDQFGEKVISIDKNGFEILPNNINHLNLNFFNNKDTEYEKLTKSDDFPGIQLPEAYYYIDKVELVLVEDPDLCDCNNGQKKKRESIVYNLNVQVDEKLPIDVKLTSTVP